MGETILYKYLDANGGYAMLYSGTLMFTNATQLNDPFDCHPALIDFPSDSLGLYQGIPSSFYSKMEYQKGINRRDKTYICSLTKVRDSILMWSYYTKHSGICIGLDMAKTRKYISNMMGLWLGCAELEVEYKDVINEPPSTDLLCYHFATKAKEWQHEQEVRLITYDPSPMHMRLSPQTEEHDRLKDWKEVRAFLDIGGECFESVYLGVRFNEEYKEKVINVAKERNPNINIYKMTIDPKAFRLKEELIERA